MSTHLLMTDSHAGGQSVQILCFCVCQLRSLMGHQIYVTVTKQTNMSPELIFCLSSLGRHKSLSIVT